jgi:hypothetical protein
MGSYSFDVYKKMVFEKEIEHIYNKNKNDIDYNIEANYVISYMQDRIKEIDKEYGESPVRD